MVREALHPERVVDLGRDASGAQRFTTPGYFQAEARLFSAAEQLAERDRLRLGTVGVDRSLGRWAPHLSEEQRDAVLHATTGGDLAQIVGRAGAGKTTAAQAIAAAYRDEGYQVRGAALAGKAAEALERETGIPSRTLASLEQSWKNGRDRLHDTSVLVIDEAGMIDTRQLGRVLEHAQEQRGAKVVLLGDPAQLKAIGAGDAFRGLLEKHESANLETIRRQVEPWQREASQDLASGRVASALDSYELAGRLHWTGTRDEARAELVGQYLEDRRGGQPETAQLIVAYRNADVRSSTRRCAPSAAPRASSAGVRVGGAEYAAGDRLVFLQNDHQGRQVANLESRATGLGVKNGTLGTVERAETERFTVRLDDGRRVAFDPREYETLAHGYAVTIHKAQGATVERVYALADPMMNRNAAYVELTRHREGVHLYADRETFGDRPQLDRVLSRENGKDLARDYAAADVGRLVSRIEMYRHEAESLRVEARQLSGQRTLHQRAQEAGQSLDHARASVERAAVSVYARPAEAARALLADPRALERLSAGQVAAYGELRGRTRLLLGDDATRAAALRHLPELGLAVRHHDLAHKNAGPVLEAAGRIGLGVAEIGHRLSQLGRAVSRLERASRAPEQALEATLRGLGREATRAALSLLPPAARIPVRFALDSIRRALSRGLDLGR